MNKLKILLNNVGLSYGSVKNVPHIKITKEHTNCIYVYVYINVYNITTHINIHVYEDCESKSSVSEIKK